MDIWKEHSEAAKKERWKALWAMEDLPRPLWFIPACPMLAVPEERMRRKLSVDRLFTDKEVQLKASLGFNRFFKPVQRVWSRDDFVLRLQPQMGVGVLASAFGCRIVFPPEQMPWSHYVINANEDASRVHDLSPPDVRAGLLGEVLDFAAFFQKKTKGRYPIAITDLQGPINTASLIWDTTDFMAAMYSDPEAVHHLMRLTTDLTIKFVKEFRSQVGEFVPSHFPPVYLPDGMGIAVSEDNMAMMSPSTYAKFSVPYLNELSEEFGGIVIHSCGNIEHQLSVLAKVHKLRGINFGVSETRFEAVWEKLGGKTAIIPHCSSETIVEHFRNALEWIEHVLRIKTHNRGLALMVPPDVGNMHQAKHDRALGKSVSYYDNQWDLLRLGYQIRTLIQKYA